MPPLPRWCVTYTDGCCLTSRYTTRPLPTAKVVPTRCGRWVLYPLAIGLAQPTCPDCLLSHEDPERWEKQQLQTATVLFTPPPTD